MSILLISLTDVYKHVQKTFLINAVRVLTAHNFYDIFSFMLSTANSLNTQAFQTVTAEPFHISFIIPVYNEEQNIGKVLAGLYNVLGSNKSWNWETIIVEDGSTDNTRRVILEEVRKYSNIQLILHERNCGYTTSLKDGIARARGNYLMYIGADEEFDCSELPSFINPLLSEGPDHADVVLGVRWQRNAYGLFRFFLSVIYIFFLNYLFKLRVNDYNWSQAWCRKLLDQIELQSKSLFVLPEIIIKAHNLKYRIKEVPSNHRGRQAGKSSLTIRLFAHAFTEAITFWLYWKSKKYNPSAHSLKTEPARARNN